MQSPCWEGDWPITQLFGVNPIKYAPYNLAGHNGLDVALPEGTLLKWPFQMTIVEVGYDALGYGNYAKGQTSGGLQLLYAHQQHLPYNAVGDSIPSGTPAGHSGNTGNSTGPHLHLGYRQRDLPFYRGWPFNGYLDPREFLDALQDGSWPNT